MTSPDARLRTGPHGEPDDEPGPGRHHHRLTRAVAALVVAAAVAGLLAAVWTWRHPTALPETTSGVGTSGEARVEEAFLVWVAFDRDASRDTLDVSAAEPRIRRDTTGADLTVGLCTLDPTGVAVSSARVEDPTEVCTRWEPLGGDGLRFGGDGEGPSQLLLLVEPRRPGTLEVAGIDLTYDRGWRSGTQAVGEHLLLTVTD